MITENLTPWRMYSCKRSLIFLRLNVPVRLSVYASSAIREVRVSRCCTISFKMTMKYKVRTYMRLLKKISNKVWKLIAACGLFMVKNKKMDPMSTKTSRKESANRKAMFFENIMNEMM